MILAYAQLAASMALVGANVAVAKLLAEALPIPVIAFLRCVLACLVLWPLMRWMEPGEHVAPRIRRNLFWQAAFGTALYNAGVLMGLRLTGALEGGLVLATLPAAVAIGAALWLGEKLSPRAWGAVALAVCGMAAISIARSGGDGAGSMLGNAFIFTGVIGEAVYVLLAKRIAGQVRVITASFWMQLFSTAILLPFAFWSAPDFALPLLDARLAGLLTFHSLTASVLCLLLWFRGLRRAPANIAGIFCLFLPATAALCALLILNERATPLHAAGFLLMLGSILLVTWPRRKA